MLLLNWGSRRLRSKPASPPRSDPGRNYLSSAYVRLETVPKASYTGRILESAFYDVFFGSTDVEWCREWEKMNAIAEEEARRSGLGALDALHVAAAYRLAADEFVTTEGPNKPVHRSRLVRVVYLYA
jgi:hypothetical protein